MIDPRSPDYADTPASPQRPTYHYGRRHDPAAPDVTIITPYYNTRPIFQETVLSVMRLSLTNWEWIIVDDGSTDPASIAQLDRLKSEDSRVQVIRQANAGPAAARNTAMLQARGRYLFQIDSDDLVEPTFLEKCLWFLETHAQFAFCNTWGLGFGTQTYLWRDGFQKGVDFLHQNWVPPTAVIRREAHLASGGYDSTIRHGHEDWDYWMSLAAHGYWGYTIQEFHVWYRRQVQSRLSETVDRPERERAFRDLISRRYRRVRRSFPNPQWDDSKPYSEIALEQPFANRLEKPAGTKRILAILPWLETGGADKFNLDMIRWLPSCEFTVVTTQISDQPWLHDFARYTPDIFCLDRFLSAGDYPRFLSYLIETRQIDVVYLSHSEVGYQLLPYLREHHPDVTFLDMLHVVEPVWKDGGYPVMSIQAQPLLDTTAVSSEDLQQWMIARGTDTDRLKVCTTNIDPAEWDPRQYNRDAIRQRLQIAAETPVLLVVARLTIQKRPRFLAEILKRLAEMDQQTLCLVAGDGDEMPFLRSFADQPSMRSRLRLLGALPNAEVRELMAAADLLLLPSAYEGLALVLFEAMSMELVPVAADVGGNCELLTEACGVLIPTTGAELEAYVAAITRLCADPAQRQRMGSAGRQRIIAHFSREQFAMPAAIDQAEHLHSAAPRPVPDRQLSRSKALATVEQIRADQVAIRRLRTVQAQSWYEMARYWRVNLLPPETRRFRAYKALRMALRRAGIG